MKTTLLLVSLSILLPFCMWYFLRVKTKISCIVSVHSPIENNVPSTHIRDKIAGYYSAFGGIYIRVSPELPLSYWVQSPDAFVILNLVTGLMNYRYLVAVGEPVMQMVDAGTWSIYDPKEKHLLFINKPKNPHHYISNPPQSGWKETSHMRNASSHLEYQIIVDFVHGSLQDSPSVLQSSNFNPSNLDDILSKPSTYLLLTIICAVAVFLFASRTDPSAVSFSYASIASKGAPYWRMVTASFSHFDLLHLGFNTMSLYQLGVLENVYGSLPYLYLSVAMVFITMMICAGIYHIQLTRYGMAEAAHQEGVGYSCVLFAWMVAISVRMKTFCPIFLMPSLCFTTYFLRMPVFLQEVLGIDSNSALSAGIPFNIGPFILLIVTKVIMPRSSFIGHLSGILIGYPLAWNMLNWLSPPMLLGILTGLFVWKEGLWVWKIAGFEQRDVMDFAAFIPVAQLQNYSLLFWSSIAVYGRVLFSIYSMGPLQALPRLVLAFLVWSVTQARKCEWILAGSVTNVSMQQDIVSIMMVTGIYVYSLILYDMCNLAATYACSSLLSVRFGLSMQWISISLIGYSLVALAEIAFFISNLRCLWEIRSASSLLVSLRLDWESVKQDLKWCGLMRSEAVVPFSGRPNRLADASIGNRVVNV